MTCDKAQRLLPLFLFDELSLEEENAVHEHIDSCPACRTALERERAMHQLLEDAEQEVPPGLLVRCRAGLRNGFQMHPVPVARQSFWRRLWDMPMSPVVWKPLGAMALVAVGFFGARLLPVSDGGDSFLRAFRSNSSGPVAERVRYVNTDSSGGVKLIVDETRQRVLSGRLDDDRIRGLMLSAAQDPSDPGLRVETMDILKGSAESADVRGALLHALQNDDNVGVRLKAIEGLKQFSEEPETRKALANVLLTDRNAGVRTKAIDLLVQQRHMDTVGVLQELIRTEDNSYIRQRCQRALREMNASVETF